MGYCPLAARQNEREGCHDQRRNWHERHAAHSTAANELAGVCHRLLRRQRDPVGRPQQFRRRRRSLVEILWLDQVDDRADAERVLARIPHHDADRRLAHRPPGPAPYPGRLHGRLVDLGAVHADRAGDDRADGAMARPPRRVRGALHPRQLGCRRPRRLIRYAARPVRRLRPIGCAIGTRGGRCRRRCHSRRDPVRHRRSSSCSA